MMLATEKALQVDADLLSGAEHERVLGVLAELRVALSDDSSVSRVQLLMGELDDATRDWAGRRMNRAIRAAIGGKRVGDVEESVSAAAGVDAHLEAHGALLPKDD